MLCPDGRMEPTGFPRPAVELIRRLREKDQRHAVVRGDADAIPDRHRGSLLDSPGEIRGVPVLGCEEQPFAGGAKKIHFLLESTNK